ncbi:tRNA/rRNA methyltransferase (SpoU) family protein [Abeliophyllum distichum]|uniref:rRNA methyltransferase 1, mitochondrial n=1 Tax=Abeliophyllum distichum TaxID=126358 RepID=A0ABD1NXS0_9LAMI
MAKAQAFPLAFRISSRPPKMQRKFHTPKPLSLLAGHHPALGSSLKTHEQFHSFGPRNSLVESRFECSREVGFCVRNAFRGYLPFGNRRFSSSYSEKVLEGSGKTLPWLATSKANEGEKLEKNVMMKTSRSSWEESAEKFLKGGASTEEVRVTRNFEGRRNEYRNKDESDEELGEENWGRKTWKEATESTLPKIVGEGIYGVGPVLAALSAGRREFYALYVQEGLDLSTNNRKKKDKKGFEKVMKMAEKIGLCVKEVSKHDLNMVSDNRPHQGLVLDASPLEMNLGAIIRSAYFFGASGVVLCAKNSAPLSGVVSKASAGSLELMELRSCKNMMQFLTSSAENGWRVLGGSVSSQAVPLNEIVPGAPTILVLGSEGTGLRPLVERSCTQLIRIPGNLPVDVIAGGDEEVDTVQNPYLEVRSFLAVESLNVSVAAGVLLHHLIGNDTIGHLP